MTKAPKNASLNALWEECSAAQPLDGRCGLGRWRFSGFSDRSRSCLIMLHRACYFKSSDGDPGRPLPPAQNPLGHALADPPPLHRDGPVEQSAPSSTSSRNRNATEACLSRIKVNQANQASEFFQPALIEDAFITAADGSDRNVPRHELLNLGVNGLGACGGWPATDSRHPRHHATFFHPHRLSHSPTPTFPPMTSLHSLPLSPLPRPSHSLALHA